MKWIRIKREHPPLGTNVFVSNGSAVGIIYFNEKIKNLLDKSNLDEEGNATLVKVSNPLQDFFIAPNKLIYWKHITSGIGK